MRILVIEDTDSIRRMIEALIAGRGYEVDSATNGARGIELALEKKPDVVLCDLNLPGNIDGCGVTARLRSEESSKGTPIIIISALDDEESKSRALGAGANAYYTKPFSPMALLKEIQGFKNRLAAT